MQGIPDCRWDNGVCDSTWAKPEELVVSFPKVVNVEGMGEKVGNFDFKRERKRKKERRED